MMLAYRLLNWQQPPQPAEVEVPRPGRGEVLVRVAANGLCHSDASMAMIPEAIGLQLGWQMPFTLGHEAAGWVAETGEGVSGLAEGQAVALTSPYSCGECRYCIRGLDSACPNGLAGRGYGRDGGLAPYVVARAFRDVVPLGTLDPIVAGPLTDAGSTSYHAVKRVLPKLTPGSTAVVIGAGGLGAFAVQYLRVLSPARVVVVDSNEARLGYARELGAHDVLIGVSATTAGDVRSLTGGEGADAVFDFVGIDATVDAGVAVVRPGGSFALVGAGGGKLTRPWYGGLPRDGEVFNFQGSTVADLREVLALAESGQIRCDVDVFPFERVAEAYEALASGTLRGRAVVTPAT